MLMDKKLTNKKPLNPYLPAIATVLENRFETPDIFTLRLKFKDPQLAGQYHFEPGQFNMLYMPGDPGFAAAKGR